MPDRLDLAFRKGWVLTTRAECSLIRGLDVVQRFTSWSGWVNAVTVGTEGLACTCLGWRKGKLCWHVRFVLRWNFKGGELGTFFYRLPDLEDALRYSRGSWLKWFEKEVVAVTPDMARHCRGGEPRLTPPSIRS
jgi:hypothetical protein